MLKKYLFFVIAVIINLSIIVNAEESTNLPIYMETNNFQFELGYHGVYCYGLNAKPIYIKETFINALKKGDIITLRIIPYDSYEFRWCDFEVTESNLKLKKLDNNGFISFEVEEASTDMPATIEINNIQIKVPTPIDKKELTLFVATFVNEDSNTIDYIKNATTTKEYGYVKELLYNPFSYELKYEAEKSQAYLNGFPINVLNQAYYSKNNNMLMLPLEQTLSLCGFRNANIIWDEPNKICTVTLPYIICSFSANSGEAIINGIETPLSSDGKTVTPEIKDEKFYLPYTAFSIFLYFDVTLENDNLVTITQK